MNGNGKERDKEKAGSLNYFALLGVSEDVSQEELDTRYQELAEHFASREVTANLKVWASRQAALIDEAYAVLADPERRAEMRQGQRAAPSASGPSDEQTEREATQRAATRDPGKERRRDRRGVPDASASLYDRLLGLRSQPLVVGAIMGLVVLGAILVGRYGFPDNGGTSEATEVEQPTGAVAPLDTELIADLAAQVEADPANSQAMFDLGETYFQAGEWEQSIDWFTKFLAKEPDNIHARTDVGTSNFNLGNFDAAQAAWTAVLELDPNDTQAHYNLGFLYANAEPQDIAAAIAEWQKVVELEPGSELASVAQAHLDGLQEGQATPTPTPTP